jgi:VanZ family protein
MSRSYPLRKTWAFATIAWIGVIFFSSTSTAGRWAESLYRTISRLFYDSSKGQGSDLLHLLADKGFHVSLFLILAISLWKTIPDAPFKVAAILLFGLLVGSCSELLQALFPDRDPALTDVLINLGGTAAGVLLCLAVTRWLPRAAHGSVLAP